MKCRKSIIKGENIRCPEEAIIENYCVYHWNCQHYETEDYDDYKDEISTTIDSALMNSKSLENFSKDKENVHTAPLVQKTIQVSEKLINLATKNLTSYDTLISILKVCELTDKAQDHMLENYFSNSSIYELPAPTFKKVLDGLWIYIQEQHKEIKVNLIERLRQELEDNTGTCAQGNLSRLVNVLNGFTHSTEKELSLGDIMKDLTKISDLRTRLTKAIKILKERKLSDEDFASWIELIL